MKIFPVREYGRTNEGVWYSVCYSLSHQDKIKKQPGSEATLGYCLIQDPARGRDKKSKVASKVEQGWIKHKVASAPPPHRHTCTCISCGHSAVPWPLLWFARSGRELEETSTFSVKLVNSTDKWKMTKLAYKRRQILSQSWPCEKHRHKAAQTVKNFMLHIHLHITFQTFLTTKKKIKTKKRNNKRSYQESVLKSTVLLGNDEGGKAKRDKRENWDHNSLTDKAHTSTFIQKFTA